MELNPKDSARQTAAAVTRATTTQNQPSQAQTIRGKLVVFLSIPSLYCNDWDDTFVSRSYGTGAGNCYCNCENEDGCGANCTRGGNWVKNDIITCTSKTTTWSCVPTCTATSPSTPTLISPSNGSTISSTSVTLAWSNTGQTWGTACGSQNNQFRVYIGTSPSSLGLLGTVGSGTAGRLPESST